MSGGALLCICAKYSKHFAAPCTVGARFSINNNRVLLVQTKPKQIGNIINLFGPCNSIRLASIVYLIHFINQFCKLYLIFYYLYYQNVRFLWGNPTLIYLVHWKRWILSREIVNSEYNRGEVWWSSVARLRRKLNLNSNLCHFKCICYSKYPSLLLNVIKNCLDSSTRTKQAYVSTIKPILTLTLSHIQST